MLISLHGGAQLYRYGIRRSVIVILRGSAIECKLVDRQGILARTNISESIKYVTRHIVLGNGRVDPQRADITRILGLRAALVIEVDLNCIGSLNRSGIGNCIRPSIYSFCKHIAFIRGTVINND